MLLHEWLKRLPRDEAQKFRAGTLLDIIERDYLSSVPHGSAAGDRLSPEATDSGIVPERIYPPEEAAELIGITSARRAKTIREFPPEILPAVPISPNGRRIGYYGRDLIRFIRERRPKHAPRIAELS